MKLKMKRKEKDNKIKIQRKDKNKKKSDKTRSIIAYILCNKQLKEFRVKATRKFNVDDETYVIKSKCCYFKKVNGIFEMVAYYVEGNPNPFNLENYEDNTGLNEDELDRYIGGDMFNILIECQEEDKKKYTINLVVACFIMALIQFVSVFFRMW